MDTELRESRLPSTNNAFFDPTRNLLAKSRVARREVLCAVIERAELAAARTHASTGATRLFNHRHVNSVICQRPRARRTRDPCTDDRDFDSSRSPTHNLCEAVDIEPCRMFFECPRPNCTEHRNLGLKRAIEETKTPEKPGVTCRISAIERSTVVQVQQRRNRRFRRSRPCGNRFPPRHSHVVVQLAMHQERPLREIPKLISCCTAHQSIARQHAPRIATSLLQRTLRPKRQAFKRRMGGLVTAPVVRKFSPNQQFVEELLCALASRCDCLSRNAHRRNHAKVEVR